ncbi:MAG TPA: Asp-tRNA(Asn)/Glu-tRNA(Gln) amidotransferase subunit GatA [Bacteroidota bacterium]|mgnify:FL=1|nr:Asp-tRNA(Asn)/Glu-tRNA(Gln) amidotransferase subunit GatA [Bacteroidota bacterium]
MNKTFKEIKQSILDGQTSLKNEVKIYLDNIKNQSDLNAFLQIYESEALEQAEIIDNKIKEGSAGKLAGLVIAIKDVICIKDKIVTCGSKILENFISLYDATVIKKLKENDALIIGKTNMDEFAMGSSNENSAYGIVKNPLDKTKVPGGSSGGSAVAVAANLSTTSLGSDTGGSIRQPASFCGIFGLKPTYGRVSRFGLVAYASSFDTIGPFANSAYDIAAVLEVIAGYDPNDSTSANIPVPEYTKLLDKNISNLRIGLPKEYLGEGLSPEIRELIENKIDFLKSKGAIIKSISLPHTEYTIASYYILTTAEASSNLARYDGARYGFRDKSAKDLESLYTLSRSKGFGKEVKRRIMLGTFVLSAGYYDAYYKKAQRVRRLIKEDFDKAFSEVDCILTPTTPTTAFGIGEKTDDPLTMYLSDIYTVSANLAGIPGINIPIGKDKNGLPIGMQLLGKQFDEQTILKIADLF